MKKIGRLVFKITKPTKKDWNIGFSFIIYKNKGEYFVKASERINRFGKNHIWTRKIELLEMMILINHSRKRNGSGKITINTIPKEVMDKANRELILHRLE